MGKFMVSESRTELVPIMPNDINLRQRRKYGNIDGIATLTNNPIATDNAKGTIGKIGKVKQPVTAKPKKK